MSDTLIAPLLAVLVVLSGGSALVLASGAHDDLAGGPDAAAIASQHEPDLILAFTDDYAPGKSLLVIDRLDQGTTNAILDRTAGEESIIGNPTDYRGYVVQLRPTENVTGEFTFVFVREATLQADTLYQFDDDATFFSTDAGLVEVGISRAEEQATPEDGTPTPEDGTPTLDGGTPTPEEGTPTPGDRTPTPDEGTPTPEDGTPTPEPNGGSEDERTATDDSVATGETPTPEAEGENGLLAGLVEFVAGLFGGSGDDDSQQTTVEPEGTA